MSRKLFIILKREYLTRVKSKGFIIGTLLGPLLMLAIVFLPVLFTMMTIGDTKVVYIYDTTGEYGSSLSGLKNSNNDADFSKNKLNLSNKEMDRMAEESSGKTLKLISYKGTADLPDFKKMMQDSIDKETVFGYLIIESKSDTLPELTFYAKSTSDYLILSSLERKANDVFRVKNLNRLGISPAIASELNKKVEMKTIKISQSGESEDKGFGMIIGFVMGFIIYTTIFAYGSVVMQSALEEKQSRIVEVIISSVHPFDLLMGKVLGIGLLALTQYIVWGLGIALIGAYGVAMVNAVSAADLGASFSISGWVITAFIFYFMLGYLIYSSFYAAVGSSVDSLQDAQQLMMPVTLLVIIPIMLITFVGRDPNSTLSVIASLIPFFTPILMTVRIAIETPPLWQIMLSIVLMIATIVGMIWAAAKVYRVGILMYGKKITFGELIRWIRY